MLFVYLMSPDNKTEFFFKLRLQYLPESKYRQVFRSKDKRKSLLFPWLTVDIPGLVELSAVHFS